MNFLAHLALSCEDPELQMGNFLGDFTKGKIPTNYPIGVQKGIELHRLIDVTTDEHPSVKAMAARLKTRHGRYSGVITDVMYDYFLYLNWDKFNLPPFDEFRKAAYKNLEANTHYLSEEMTARIGRMVRADWLLSYTSQAGIITVFERMLPRFSRPRLLSGVPRTLFEEDAAFNQSILQLFPDLKQTVNQFCGCD